MSEQQQIIALKAEIALLHAKIDKLSDKQDQRYFDLLNKIGVTST